MATTNLQAHPAGSVTDAPSGPAADLALGNSLEKYTVMRFADATARDAAITSPEEGMNAYLTGSNVTTWYDGTAWRGDWVTSFDPTIDQGASANIAHTVAKSEYRYDGPVIEWWFSLVLTAAGDDGNTVLVDLPVTALSATGSLQVGAGLIVDTGTAEYPCAILLASTTQISFYSRETSNLPWGQIPNIALASTDSIRGHVRYRWV